MEPFLTSLLCTGLFFSVTFFSIYAVASYKLLSAVHGSIVEWEALLSNLRCAVSSDQVSLDAKQGVAILKARVSSDELHELNDFIKNHRAVDYAKRRLDFVSEWKKWIVLACFLGFLSSLVIKAPMIWGWPPLGHQLPSLEWIVASVGPVFFILFIGLPQVYAWNRLKNS